MGKPVDTHGDAVAEPRHCSRSYCISVFVSQRQRELTLHHTLVYLPEREIIQADQPRHSCCIHGVRD